MTIQEFAKQHRLKTIKVDTKDGLDDDYVQGRLYKDASISGHDHGKLSMNFLVDGRPGAPLRTGLFNRVKKECLEAGMTISQEGDSEAIFVFDPENPKQAKLAIKSIKARAKKQLSPERVAKQVAILAKYRSQAKVERVS